MPSRSKFTQYEAPLPLFEIAGPNRGLGPASRKRTLLLGAPVFESLGGRTSAACFDRGSFNPHIS